MDEDHKRVRGKDNRQAAELALARVKVAGQWRPSAESAAEEGEWNVAKVCSRYIEYCQRCFAAGSICVKHRKEVVRYLNQLCAYCGVLPVSQLTKGHVQHWLENQADVALAQHTSQCDHHRIGGVKPRPGHVPAYIII